MPKDFSKKLVDLPKRRQLVRARKPGWIVLEPSRIGMAGGAAAGTFALIVYYLRGLFGDPVPPIDVLIGALLTFVVGYGAVGLFVWYLLIIAEREIPVEEVVSRYGATRSESSPANAEGVAPAEVTAPSAEES